MASIKPQYFKNNLRLIRVDKETLSEALSELRKAVAQGVTVISANAKVPDASDNHEFGTIYNGHLGIVLMSLRLQRQAKHLQTEDMSTDTLISEVQGLANTRLNPQIVKAHLHAGRLSPLGSASFGAPVVRIIAAGQGLPLPTGDGYHRIHKRDIAEVQNAVCVALHQGNERGGDELLYGRVGLLHAILNIRKLRLDDASAEALRSSVFESIPRLVDCIISAGGILDMLLACEPGELGCGHFRSHASVIAQTINALCNLCILNHGHVPSSVPHRCSSRTSPLVQICHGAPGLLILLSNARKNAAFSASYWRPEWDEAIRLASDKVWEQGVLYKGGSLCHGMAGNAWPFLMLHDIYEYGPQGSPEAKEALSQVVASVLHKERPSSDYFLSRAIALLLEARNTPPFKREEAGDGQYRMPDNPYSLFEGLAGTICAWAEACVVIAARLRSIEVDEIKGSDALSSDREFRSDLQDELGMPGLGVRGFL
ncbi:hypothetical protein PRK78_001280 [Emydomyces testavorans]|uniref:Lanthionine synthetase C family protein n=1 Tax=Emydomyces testavorans TaxID=2070801 RepID=A0AAF0DCF7_9EURO|nr:hypothetical protein PRK78_001280 [Emydomyces testavorans]